MGIAINRVILLTSLVILISFILQAEEKRVFKNFKGKMTLENWEEIKKDFKNYDTDSRIKIIVKLKGLPVSPKEKAEFLYNAMLEEIKDPTENFIGSLEYNTEILKYRYIIEIIELGEEGKNELYKFYKNAKTDEEKGLLAMALLKAKDVNYLDEVWNIVKYSKINEYRECALSIIVNAKLYKPEDIPFLKSLLKDPFHKRKRTDFFSREENITYPIRLWAATALKDMGVKVKINKNNFTLEE